MINQPETKEKKLRNKIRQIEKDKIIYVLNEEDKRADIIDTDDGVIENILIPRSIQYESQEYIIISVKEGSFRRRSIKSIEFSPDSKLQTIEGESFNSSILKLSLPASVSELQKKWCFQVNFDVTISPENKYFKKIEGGMIVGKSNPFSEEYDTLLFVNRDIETVTIPPNITKIEAYSFSMSSIEKVFISSSVTEICEFAFYLCQSLEKVEFEPNSKLKIIHKSAFQQSSLHEFSLPPSVSQICDSAFSCRQLEKFLIPSNSELKIIENRAFFMSSITNIFIPNHVTKICEGTFNCCRCLQKVEFASDSKLKTIENDAFSGTSLTSLTFPDNLSDLQTRWCSELCNLSDIQISPKNKHFKKIEGEMIVGKSNIESDEYDILIYVFSNNNNVEIPSYIKMINSYSFSQKMIEKVFIPTEVTEICEGAFFMSKSLKEVKFASDSKLQIIHEKSFYGCNISKISIPSHVKQICSKSFMFCQFLESIEIPENSELEKIEEGAFFDTSIESISIPSNVSELEEGWCNNTQYLTSFSISPKNKYFKSFEGKMIVEKSNKKDDDDNYNIISFVNRDIIEIQIPSSITKISSSSFSYSLIERVFIPHHITKISSLSFYKCDRLQEVIIDPNSNLQKFEKNTFYGSLLKSIFIPSSVTIIGEYAFFSCGKLKYVQFAPDSKLQAIEKSAFQYTMIRSFFIPSTVTSIYEDSFDINNFNIFELADASSLELITKVYDYCDYIYFMVPVKSN